MMHVVATLLSANSELVIREAIDSAGGLVDRELLIDTGITDRTREVAEERLGERLVVETFAWCGDFARARNFALEAAARCGAEWAMTLDTDERMEFPGIASREELVAALESDPRVRVWLVMEKGGRYAKERFVRVERVEVRGQRVEEETQGADAPRSPVRWVGRVHEALVGLGPGEAKVLPGVLFWEVKKPPEEFAAKLQRDLVALEQETRERPDDPRWWYYLGQTLEGLGRHREAVNAFRRCLVLPGWDEQAAWAAYKGAECLCVLKEFAVAVELCALGLARQPGSPELAWLAGWCCYQDGKLREAIHWERIAIALGNVEGCHAGEGRISFRHLPAWYEGPYDVLRWAYRKLGDGQAAAEAERRFREARDQRGRDGGPG